MGAGLPPNGGALVKAERHCASCTCAGNDLRDAQRSTSFLERHLAMERHALGLLLKGESGMSRPRRTWDFYAHERLVGRIEEIEAELRLRGGATS